MKYIVINACRFLCCFFIGNIILSLSYHVPDKKTGHHAQAYSKTHESLARYLTFRDMPSLLTRYVHGTQALDYGVGTGSSLQFLRNQGFDVTGVDVSEDMLAKARIVCPDNQLHLIKNGQLPFAHEQFDLVFSSFVLFEIDSKEAICKYLQEAKRVLKKDGIFIAITGSEYTYAKDWLLFNVDYPENKNLKSGDLAKAYLYDADIEFLDYYWTEKDYRECFESVGLELLEVYYPLGKREELYPWKDERTFSPYVIFVERIC